MSPTSHVAQAMAMCIFALAALNSPAGAQANLGSGVTSADDLCVDTKPSDLDINYASPNGTKYSCAEYLDMKACDHPTAGPYVRSICQKTCGACPQQCNVLELAANATKTTAAVEPDDTNDDDDDGTGNSVLSLGRAVNVVKVAVASGTSVGLKAAQHDIAGFAYAVTTTVVNGQKKCWRNTQPCPANTYAWYDDGALVKTCTEECPSGYRDDGHYCSKGASYGRGGGYGIKLVYDPCPSGFKDTGVHCLKPGSYGRGSGYNFFFKDGWKNCRKDHGQNGCEKSGLIVYPKCRSGYKAFGCCVCSPKCPSGWQDIGVSCTKPRKTLNAVQHCESKHGAGRCETCLLLAYPKCRANYHNAGCNVCSPDCPGGMSDMGVSCRKKVIKQMGLDKCNFPLPYACGLACTIDKQGCTDDIVNSVVSVLSSAVSIAALVATAGASSAATTAAKMAGQAANVGANSAVALSATAAKAARYAAKLRKGIMVGIGISVYLKIFEEKEFFSTLHTATTGIDRDQQEAVIADLHQATTAVVESEAQKDSALKVSQEVLSWVSVVDPTGLTAVAEAFTAGKCSDLAPPFPKVTFKTVTETQPAGFCERPSGWCRDKKEMYLQTDCDGDGIKDHVCADTNNNYGTITSTSGCAVTWPSGKKCQDIATDGVDAQLQILAQEGILSETGGNMVCEVNMHPLNTATNKYAGVLDKHFANQATLGDCQQRCAETSGCTVLNYFASSKNCWIKGGWQYGGPSTLFAATGHTSCYVSQDSTLITIGNSHGTSTKVVTAPVSKLNCPAIINKQNWHGTESWGDEFQITVSGSRVTATRRHVASHQGWGMDLKFYCATPSTATTWDFEQCPKGRDGCTAATKHVKKHCYSKRIMGPNFNTWADAKAACLAKGDDCYGVYDNGCNQKKGIYLCDGKKVKGTADLSNSGSSCVFPKP